MDGVGVILAQALELLAGNVGAAFMKKGLLRPLLSVNSPNLSTSLSTMNSINSCLYASMEAPFLVVDVRRGVARIRPFHLLKDTMRPIPCLYEVDETTPSPSIPSIRYQAWAIHSHTSCSVGIDCWAPRRETAMDAAKVAGPIASTTGNHEARAAAKAPR